MQVFGVVFCAFRQFVHNFRQILHLRKPKSKAAEAALYFSLVQKNVPPIWREILFLFRSQIKRIERILRIFLFLPVIKILSLMIAPTKTKHTQKPAHYTQKTNIKHPKKKKKNTK